MPRFIWFDPIPAGVVQTVTRQYRATYVDETSATTYTFTGCDIGAAVAGRVVGVGITGVSSSSSILSISSGTIAGSAAGVKATTSSSNNAAAGVIAAVVGSGTTATITVTFDTTFAGCAIHVYAIYGASSATAYDTSAFYGSSAGTLDIPAGGVAIGAGYNRTPDVTWTVTGLSQDAAANFDVAAYCTASVESLIAQNNASVRLLPSAVLKTHQAFVSFSG